MIFDLVTRTFPKALAGSVAELIELACQYEDDNLQRTFLGLYQSALKCIIYDRLQ